MHRSRMTWIAGAAAAALGSTGAACAANLMAPGNLADICPTADQRDTIQSVRASVAARLGDPIKEEAIGTQYVLTYRQKDGSQLLITLTHDSGKLEASCDRSEP